MATYHGITEYLCIMLVSMKHGAREGQQPHIMVARVLNPASRRGGGHIRKTARQR